MEKRINSQSEDIDVSPLRCKSHKDKVDLSCAHCKAVSALLSKDKRSKSSYGAASSSRTTSTSAGGSRSYRGKAGRGVNPTDKERRSSRGADRTKVNDEDEANSPERKRARRKGKGAGKRVSVFSLLFR